MSVDTPPPYQTPDPAKKIPIFRRFSKRVATGLRLSFYRLGYFVAGNPWKTIIGTVLICALCMIGMTKFYTENRPERLWVPQSTQALRNKEWIGENFPVGTRQLTLLTTKVPEGGDVLTKESLLELINILEITEKTTATLDGETLRFRDLCEYVTNGVSTHCTYISPVTVFYDSSNLESSFIENVRKSIELKTDAEIKSYFDKESFTLWYGEKIKRSDILGPVEGSGSSISAEITRSKIRMINNEIEKDGTREDPKAMAWETQWTSSLDVDTLPGVESVRWYMNAQSSFDEATDDSLTKDLGKFIVGYFLLLVYLSVNLGEFNKVKSRIMLSFMAVFSVGMAIGATYGFASALGTYFGPVHQVLPLLLLGIGMDDAFVVCTAFDATDENMPIRERIALALSKAGSSITVTSLSNSSAFFIGALTTMPALRYFAIWAGIGILFIYFYQTTFFIACLTFDAQRQQQKKMDVLFCKRVEQVKAENCCGALPGVMGRFFTNTVAPFILEKRARAVILLLLTAGFAVNMYGLLQLGQEFEPEYFFLEGTYSKDYDNKVKEYFPENGLFVQFFTGKMDYTSLENQHSMYDLFTTKENGGYIANNEFILPEKTDNWYIKFREFHGKTNRSDVFAPEEFMTELQTFLNSPVGNRFNANINILNNEITGTRSNGAFGHLATNDIQVDAMQTLREDMDKAGLDLAFPYAFLFLFFEQYAVIMREAVQAMSFSLIVVFCVALVLIGDPLVAVVTILGVGFSVVDILGIMHYWDININSVSVVTLSLAVGLTIDFSGHIGLAFMECVGNKKERAVGALHELGPPLVHGGTSTFLAISVLVFAQSYIFQVFFKMFFLILGLGMIHGLIMVPQILSLIGPSGFFESSKDREREEEEIMLRVTKKPADGNSCSSLMESGIDLETPRIDYAPQETLMQSPARNNNVQLA